MFGQHNITIKYCYWILLQTNTFMGICSVYVMTEKTQYFIYSPRVESLGLITIELAPYVFKFNSLLYLICV